MYDVISAIDVCGGAASYRALDRLGVPRQHIAESLRAGVVTRVRARWFGSPSAPDDVLRAVRVGGTLTGASVARRHRLWTMNDSRLHVRVPLTASRLAAPHARKVPLDADKHAVCVHYSGSSGTDIGCDPVAVALAEMFSCNGPEAALVALDSALNKRLITGLSDVRDLVSRDLRRFVDWADPQSQSGLETLVRLLLRRRQVRFRSQAYIDGVGRVDLLVGDRLVLELDGETFHVGANFEEDRRRDLALVRRGYVVVRLSYRQIVADWPQTSAAILELIARGEHRWGSKSPTGPLLLPFTG
ncbi:endonuclease domain-containing protein [Glaciibacter flavus]|uniref:endonuclease domain-containing protein n=1 Tax=Orlajensenia flava TaxID=2565934 RepID=UPI003AFFC058